MMRKTPIGRSPFEQTTIVPGTVPVGVMRQQLAAAALGALLTKNNPGTPAELASLAIQYADAMLMALVTSALPL